MTKWLLLLGLVVYLSVRYGSPRVRRALRRNPPTSWHRTLTTVGMLLWPVALIVSERNDGGLWYLLLLAGPVVLAGTWWWWRQSEPAHQRARSA